MHEPSGGRLVGCSGENKTINTMWERWIPCFSLSLSLSLSVCVCEECIVIWIPRHGLSVIFCLLFSLLFSFFLSLYLIRVFLQFCLSQISSRCNIDLRKQKKKDVLHEHNHCTQHQSDHTILSYSNRTFIIWCTMGSVFTKGGGCLQDSGHLIAHKCHPASFFFFFLMPCPFRA